MCLLAVPAESGTGHGGSALSWTVHNLLLPDRDRYGTYTGTQQAMNAALGGVLRAFGYPVTPFGSGGALTCFGVVCAGRVEMGDVGPGEPRRTKTERKTIRPIPKTPPLIQISRRWARGEERKPSLTEEEDDSIGS